jgi:hypothetical protein
MLMVDRGLAKIPLYWIPYSMTENPAILVGIGHGWEP